MTDFGCDCKKLARAIEDAADDLEGMVSEKLPMLLYTDYHRAVELLREASKIVIKFKAEFE